MERMQCEIILPEKIKKEDISIAKRIIDYGCENMIIFVDKEEYPLSGKLCLVIHNKFFGRVPTEWLSIIKTYSPEKEGYKDMIESIYEEKQNELNDWEKKFINNVYIRYVERNMFISEKQKESLLKINNKYK